MRKYILLLCLVIAGIPVFAQIVLHQADMPKEGDTLRVSITTNIPGDYTLTGPGMNWDFSSLSGISQQVRSFVNIMETPSLYWFTFVPGVVSNLASPVNNMQSFPGLPFSNYFTFYKKSASLFTDAGFAFELSGIPIALKYDSADVNYVLPCTMGNSWSSHSYAYLSVPGMAYLGSSRSRSSVVDGWGTLTTPFGSFETIRVKSEVIEHDSIFLDTLGFGIPYTRNITEYKWLGLGQGIPLLEIDEQGLTKTAVYRDNINHTGISELRKGSLFLYPTPANEFCIIDLGEVQFPASLQIIDTKGRLVSGMDLSFSVGKSFKLDLSGLQPGLYFIRLVDKATIYTGKVLIAR